MTESANRRKRTLGAIVGTGAAAALIAWVPKFEGERLTTYRDLGGVLTYCDGATQNAVAGRVYTHAECMAQLDADLARHAEGISHCVHLDRMTTGQKIAFVDAAYNIGVANFCRSSMARKANAGDIAGACNALLRWDHDGGVEVPGLERRRQAERKICLGES